MKIIFKYDIKDTIKPTIDIHSGAKILSIQKQNDYFKLWALIDTDNPIIKRELLLIGTGVPFDLKYVDAINHGELNHLATVQDGCLVYHFFENTMPFANEANEPKKIWLTDNLVKKIDMVGKTDYFKNEYISVSHLTNFIKSLTPSAGLSHEAKSTFEMVINLVLEEVKNG